MSTHDCDRCEATAECPLKPMIDRVFLVGSISGWTKAGEDAVRVHLDPDSPKGVVFAILGTISRRHLCKGNYSAITEMTNAALKEAKLAGGQHEEHIQECLDRVFKELTLMVIKNAYDVVGSLGTALSSRHSVHDFLMPVKVMSPEGHSEDATSSGKILH